MIWGRSESWLWKCISILAITICCFNIMVLLSGKSAVKQIVTNNLEHDSNLCEEKKSTNPPTETSLVNPSEDTDFTNNSADNGKEELYNRISISSKDADKPSPQINVPSSLKKPVWPSITRMEKFYKPEQILSLGHKKKSKAFAVFGIPTVSRKRAYYLMNTLKGLILHLTAEEKNEVVLVVFVADHDKTFRKKVVDDVREKFPEYVDSGLIQVIVAPPAYYPDMDNLPLLYGDKINRVQWRSKQSLDYSYLYYYCADIAEYYIQLEDDILVDSGYLSKIKNYISEKSSTDWSILEFGARGFIGMTYRTKHLKSLSRFCRFYFWTMPIDWLFRIFNDINLYGNSKKNVLHPPVFKHVGEYSSLDGQVRKLEDVRSIGAEVLKRVYQPKNGNPKATVLSTIDDYVVPNYIELPYGKKGFFWGKTVREDDSIQVIFDKVENIKQIIITSGSPRHPSDSLEDSELYVGTSKSENAQQCDDYVLIQTYKDSPLIDYNGKQSRLITCIKLVLKSVRYDDHRRARWLIISEIAILTESE